MPGFTFIHAADLHLDSPFKGLTVEKVLVTRAVDIADEYYVGIIMDRASKQPMFIVCREPTTDLGMVPVVAIGPGMTMRTQVDPPDDHDAPDLDWLCYAHQELGDAAIDQIDPEIERGKRIDMLMAMLDAMPEHANLHLALEETCKSPE